MSSNFQSKLFQRTLDFYLGSMDLVGARIHDIVYPRVSLRVAPGFLTNWQRRDFSLLN